MVARYLLPSADALREDLAAYRRAEYEGDVIMYVQTRWHTESGNPDWGLYGGVSSTRPLPSLFATGWLDDETDLDELAASLLEHARDNLAHVRAGGTDLLW